MFMPTSTRRGFWTAVGCMKKRDLFALPERQIALRQWRLTDRWHATSFTEPARPHGRRDASLDGRFFARQHARDRVPEPLSMLAPGKNPMGLPQYLVAYGKARITEGGAAALLQRLARIYMSPDAEFPPESIRNRPGYVTRITPERFAGIGPWSPGQG